MVYLNLFLKTTKILFLKINLMTEKIEDAFFSSVYKIFRNLRYFIGFFVKFFNFMT